MISNSSLPVIALVTKQTRMETLKQRWVTSGAIEFRMQQAASHEVEHRKRKLANQGKALSDSMLADLEVAALALADDDQFQTEDEIYQQCVQTTLNEIDLGFPIISIDRTQIPTFDFARCMAVVVVGPDGLVANTAKYVNELPIIGVNPNPKRIDGILLPFRESEARRAVQQVVKNQEKTERVTMAHVSTNDGQEMLAFNEFFVGCQTHVSARYTLEQTGKRESQSSSGVLISTGAGATGWFSSMVGMANGMLRFLQPRGTEQSQLPNDTRQNELGFQIERSDKRLVWAVREPFKSRHSQTDLIAGVIQEGEELILGSEIPQGGVIFSDGIEEDYLEFNSGSIARFSIAPSSANLVLPQ